jgi:hypothetical protein
LPRTVLAPSACTIIVGLRMAWADRVTTDDTVVREARRGRAVYFPSRETHADPHWTGSCAMYEKSGVCHWFWLLLGSLRIGKTL